MGHIFTSPILQRTLMYCLHVFNFNLKNTYPPIIILKTHNLHLKVDTDSPHTFTDMVRIIPQSPVPNTHTHALCPITSYLSFINWHDLLKIAHSIVLVYCLHNNVLITHDPEPYCSVTTLVLCTLSEKKISQRTTYVTQHIKMD